MSCIDEKQVVVLRESSIQLRHQFLVEKFGLTGVLHPDFTLSRRCLQNSSLKRKLTRFEHTTEFVEIGIPQTTR